MPELPEVETIVRELQTAGLEGKKIEDIQIFWPGVVDTSSSSEFIKQIRKQQLLQIKRRGKYLVFTFPDKTLLVHLRMTGKFQLISKDDPINKHEHVRLTFHDGTILRYEDPRKFGRWSLYKDPSEKIGELGLEPLSKEFTPQVFLKLVQKHKTQIKPFLLNQQYVAGLGNIYVDEALWEAKIHPQRLTNTLTVSEIKILHKAIQKVLKIGIKNLGTSLGSGQGNYYNVSGKRGGHQHQLKVFRLQGQACPRCGETLKKKIVAQRGTHYCPVCQKE